MDKRKLGMAIVILLLLSGGGYWAYTRYYTGPDNTIRATGTIETDSINISAKTAGSISVLKVDEGDKVTGGELVAEISRADLAAQRERDLLAVQKAAAQLADLASGPRGQEQEAAAASVNTARANYDQALLDLQRQQSLFAQGAIPQAELDHFKLAMEQVKNQLQAAGANLSLLTAGTRPQTIVAARLEVERNRAVLKADDALLDDLNVYSPINGVVLNRNYHQGEFVQTGASLATVADLNHLWIRVYLTTDDLPVVKLNQSVTFTVSGSNRDFHGVVQWIASQGEFTPKMIQTKQERAHIVFAVKIKTDSAGGLLKPGMPADVNFGRRPGQ